MRGEGPEGEEETYSEAPWSSKLSFRSKGKTTLLKHIANRALSIPPNIDVLLCEQGEAAGGRGAGGEGETGLLGAPLGAVSQPGAEEPVVVELEGFCGERLGTGKWVPQKWWGAVRGWNKYRELGRVRQSKNGAAGKREQEPWPWAHPDCSPAPRGGG